MLETSGHLKSSRDFTTNSGINESTLLNFHKFCKTEPYDFQKDVLQRSFDQEYYGLFLEQGTGKSKIVIDTFNYLRVKNKIQGIVIICPKSLIHNWSYNEILKHSKIPLENLNIKITNYENLKGVKEFLQKFDSILILDESSKIKNSRAQRTKNIIKLSQLAKYRRILTGTPVTQGIQDLYSQIEFLKPQLLGNYFQFKYHYLRIQRMTIGHRSFDKVIGHKNLDQLHEKIDSFCSRILKKDVLELPDKIYETIHLTMTSEQRAMYESLKNDLIVESEEGTITTPEVITKMLRLQQISGGFVPIENIEGQTNMMELKPNIKIEAVLDQLIEGEKTIIWSRFLAEIANLQKAIDQKFGEKTTVTYTGSKNIDERAEAVQKFTKGDSWVFIGNPQTAGHGLTLIECNKVIYFSNDFSLENRLQSEDRVHRIGQENPVVYTDLLFERSIDSYILNALSNKRSVSEIATNFSGNI